MCLNTGVETTSKQINLMESVLDASKLEKDYNQDLLVGYIQNLRCRIKELESYRLIAKRVEMLERSHLSSLQYTRREAIEISGIPHTVPDIDLENKSLEILESIGVAKINPLNVHACHRLKTGTMPL